MAEALVFAPSEELYLAYVQCPGMTAHTLLTDAEVFREHARNLDFDGQAAQAQAWRDFAARLERLGNGQRFPQPPRLPAVEMAVAAPGDTAPAPRPRTRRILGGMSYGLVLTACVALVDHLFVGLGRAIAGFLP